MSNFITINKKLCTHLICFYTIIIAYSRRHQVSKYHTDAMQAISASQPDVGVMLSHAHSEQKKLNGEMLMCILQDVQFLGRQGIPLRGHKASDSNFMQLLKLRSHDNPVRKFILVH